jgi:flagellar biosynthesis/type III secretory pathway M-ring protein FliF/YscJ
VCTQNITSLIKKYTKMKQVTDILMGAVSIAVGVAVGTWAYNKFMA